jgi:hypothetical protein
MQQILERLIVSDLSEASDPFFLSLHRVQAILYFGEGGMFGEDTKLYHHSIPSSRGVNADEILDGIEFLRESLRFGRRVLAVGTNGATIAAAYLTEMGFSSASALQLFQNGNCPKPDSQAVFMHCAEIDRRSKLTVHC